MKSKDSEYIKLLEEKLKAAEEILVHSILYPSLEIQTLAHEYYYKYYQKDKEE